MVQVLVPSHMIKVAVPSGTEQVGSPWPPVRVQVPQTIPLLSVPIVPGVAFDVPLTPPLGVVVSVRTFPEGTADVMVYVMEPVTWLAELAVKEAVPASLSLDTKHFPVLMKLKPVILSCWEPPLTVVTVNWVTKFSSLAWPRPPTSLASQFAVVAVSSMVLGVRVPQLPTASARANRVRIETIFMDTLEFAITVKNREMRAGTSMDVRGSSALPASRKQRGSNSPWMSSCCASRSCPGIRRPHSVTRPSAAH